MIPGKSAIIKPKTVLALALALLLLSMPDALAISCVRFVEASTVFALHGNAWRWWYNADGLYDRGTLPREGAVLVFKRTKIMRLGHVAVVAQIIDDETVLIDHANWAILPKKKGHIDRSIAVLDCSRDHDWSEVCVWNKEAYRFGPPHAVNGFIYPEG